MYNIASDFTGIVTPLQEWHLSFHLDPMSSQRYILHDACSIYVSTGYNAYA